MTKSALFCDSNTEPIKITTNWGLRLLQKILGLSSIKFCLVNESTGDSKCSLETEQILNIMKPSWKRIHLNLSPPNIKQSYKQDKVAVA